MPTVAMRSHPAHNLRYHNNPFYLAGAGSNSHGYYSHSGPPPDYGIESSGSADYHQPPGPPTGHMSTGAGTYHHHATGPSTGYASHPEPLPVHPPPPPPPSKKSKKGGNSAMTALTLLSFFFFVNLLQNCLKDHMTAMNPTVMVMTAGFKRKSFNKLGDVNAREQMPTSPAAITSPPPQMNSDIMMQSTLATASYATTPAMPSINVISPYSHSNIPDIFHNQSLNYNYNQNHANQGNQSPISMHNYNMHSDRDSPSYSHSPSIYSTSNNHHYNNHQLTSHDNTSPWVYEPSSFGHEKYGAAASPYSSTKRLTANNFFDMKSRNDDYEERYERIN